MYYCHLKVNAQLSDRNWDTFLILRCVVFVVALPHDWLSADILYIVLKFRYYSEFLIPSIITSFPKVRTPTLPPATTWFTDGIKFFFLQTQQPNQMLYFGLVLPGEFVQ